MRMRQSVSHPYLVVYSKKDSKPVAAISNGTVDCNLCNESPINRVVSSCCQAAFCKSCVLEYMETSAGLSTDHVTPCPSCRNPFSVDFSQAVEDLDDNGIIGPSMRNNEGLPSLRDLAHVPTGMFY